MPPGPPPGPPMPPAKVFAAHLGGGVLHVKVHEDAAEDDGIIILRILPKSPGSFFS